MALVVKKLSANAGDVGDSGLIPVPGRSPGRGHGNLFLYSCLENPLDRGAWWATVRRGTKSRTRLRQPSTHLAHTHVQGAGIASMNGTYRLVPRSSEPTYSCYNAL